MSMMKSGVKSTNLKKGENMKGYRTEKVKEILAKYENTPVELLEEINSIEEDFGDGVYTEDEFNSRLSSETESIKADYNERFKKAFFSGEKEGVTVDVNDTIAPDNDAEEIELTKAETITVDDLLKPAE